jgi:hypothetical protein
MPISLGGSYVPDTQTSANSIAAMASTVMSKFIPEAQAQAQERNAANLPASSEAMGNGPQNASPNASYDAKNTYGSPMGSAIPVGAASVPSSAYAGPAGAQNVQDAGVDSSSSGSGHSGQNRQAGTAQGTAVSPGSGGGSPAVAQAQPQSPSQPVVSSTQSSGAVPSGAKPLDHESVAAKLSDPSYLSRFIKANPEFLVIDQGVVKGGNPIALKAYIRKQSVGPFEEYYRDSPASNDWKRVGGL